MSQQERWLPVREYEGLYEVSDLGRVRSLDRIVSASTWTQRHIGRVLRPQTKTGDGRVPYHQVHLFRGDRSTCRTIHRLVLEAFVGPRPAGQMGCHNDGDPQNNALSNLRWDTPSSNNWDTVRHGRHRGAAKTHCPSGHPYSGDNLVMRLNGGILRRSCRACMAARVQRDLERRRAARAEAAA